MQGNNDDFTVFHLLVHVKYYIFFQWTIFTSAYTFKSPRSWFLPSLFVNIVNANMYSPCGIIAGHLFKSGMKSLKYKSPFVQNKNVKYQIIKSYLLQMGMGGSDYYAPWIIQQAYPEPLCFLFPNICKHQY